MKRCSTSLINREMQIKTTMRKKKKKTLHWDITSHQPEWPSWENLQTINAVEDAEKRQPLYFLYLNNFTLSLCNTFDFGSLTAFVPSSPRVHSYASTHWPALNGVVPQAPFFFASSPGYRRHLNAIIFHPLHPTHRNSLLSGQNNCICQITCFSSMGRVERTLSRSLEMCITHPEKGIPGQASIQSRELLTWPSHLGYQNLKGNYHSL